MYNKTFKNNMYSTNYVTLQNKFKVLIVVIIIMTEMCNYKVVIYSSVYYLSFMY